MNESIWIGFDQREAAAYAVARSSIRRRLSHHIPIYGLVQDDLRSLGLYRREVEKRKSAVDGDITWDIISDAAESTQFSNTRFLTKHLARKGWALFLDCDVLARADVVELFNLADDRFAVMCVKHNFMPLNTLKMDGQVQSQYERKNWSSVHLINCDHPSNRHLTIEMINEMPGRDLHRFCWLSDSEIGELQPEWNFLVRHHVPRLIDPKIVHFTAGVPSMRGYENDPFANEWREELNRWAS